MNQNDLRDGLRAFELIVQLGRALHRYGAPAYRVEAELIALAAHFRLEAQFFATPTSMFASLGEPGRQTTSMVRLDPPDVDLARLSAVEAIARRIVRGELSLEDAKPALEQVGAAPQLYGPRTLIAAFAALSSAAAILLGGAPIDALLAVPIGGLVALLALVVPREAFVVLAAASAAVAAAVAARFVPGASFGTLTIAGLIALVPGLTITVAMTELATQNLQAGTARLAGGLMVLLQLALGVLVGRLAFDALGAAPGVAPAAWPALELAAWPIAALSFVVIFHAERRDAGWVLLACAIGWTTARGAHALVGSEGAAFLAAFAVGLASHLFARRYDRPSSIISLPGIMLLVPGSLGFKSVAFFLDSDVVRAMAAAFTTSIVAVALSAGLLIASILVAPRRSGAEAKTALGASLSPMNR